MHKVTALKALKAWDNEENVYLFGQQIEKIEVRQDGLVVTLPSGAAKVVYFDTNATLSGHKLTVDVLY